MTITIKKHLYKVHMIRRKSTKFFPTIVYIQQSRPIWRYKFNITTRHWMISLSSEVQKNIWLNTIIPVHNNFWSQAVNWAWMVSCMGSWNLCPGNFKKKNKSSAEGKARGWQLAGFLLRGDPDWQGSYAQAVKGCMKGDGSTRVLCGTDFFSTNKGLQSLSPTEYLLSSLVLSFPPWSTLVHAFPSPFYFLLLSTGFKPLWNRWFPDASSKFCIGSFLPLLQGPSRGRHTWFASQFCPPTPTETLQNLLSPRQTPFCIPLLNVLNCQLVWPCLFSTG